MKHQIIGLIVSLVVCYAVSFLGATASINAGAFYTELQQPTWAPPGWLFGPVWMVLYTLMAISAWLVWRIDGFKANRAILLLFLIHLIPNALWSWVFFAWWMGLASVVTIIILWLMIATTCVGFWKVKPVAGALLLPYLAWVGFATALNITLWQMNPGLLSG
ncbi:MAG: TspO/MBR family protein [Phycisphaeraceae bacterium]